VFICVYLRLKLSLIPVKNTDCHFKRLLILDSIVIKIEKNMTKISNFLLILPTYFILTISAGNFLPVNALPVSTPIGVTCPTGDKSTWPEPPLSQIKLTIPSLWSLQKDLGSKMIERWFLVPDNNWIVVVINRQYWGLMDYLEKYQAINSLATASRSDGYNLRLCNNKGLTLAVYFCEFSSESSGNFVPSSCHLDMGSINDGIREKRKLF
jgi:hypothetical protein